jgi:hypothetical protein
VLSKSSKILFAMIMGKVVQGQSFGWDKYFNALLVTAGLAVFKLYMTDRCSATLRAHCRGMLTTFFHTLQQSVQERRCGVLQIHLWGLFAPRLCIMRQLHKQLASQSF